MGMPQVPDGNNRPTLDQTIIALLESIALEELAIAHVLNAEGEKMQEIVRKYGCEEICYCQLEDGFKNVNSTIVNLIMKEWLLVTKMANVMELKDVLCKEKKDCFKNDPCKPKQYGC